MGGNLAVIEPLVRVRYTDGSRKCGTIGSKPKARVSIVRWNLKEARGKIPG
jgi:hypothetical protein